MYLLKIIKVKYFCHFIIFILFVVVVTKKNRPKINSTENHVNFDTFMLLSHHFRRKHNNTKVSNLKSHACFNCVLYLKNVQTKKISNKNFDGQKKKILALVDAVGNVCASLVIKQ